MELNKESDYWVDSADVDIGLQIGKGAFSTVYVGRYFGDLVAIKKQSRGSTGLEGYLQRELTVLKNLRNSDQQFLVTYIGAYTEESQEKDCPHLLYIITEYCQGGELLKLITDPKKFPELGWKLRVKLAFQASSAVHHLHELNFIHRDIKSENFLLDGEWNCKLTDFGLSREIADPSVPTKMTICGTKEYTAPEMHFEQDYTSGIDIFSLGLVFVELMIRKKIGIDDFVAWRPQNKFAIEEEEWSKIPEDAPQSLSLLARQCTSYEFGDRPDSFEVKDWLADLLDNMEEDTCSLPAMPPAPDVKVKECVSGSEPAADLSKAFDELTVQGELEPPIASPSLVRNKRSTHTAHTTGSTGTGSGTNRSRRTANLFKDLELPADESSSAAVEPSGPSPANKTKSRRGAAALMDQIDQLKSNAGITASTPKQGSLVHANSTDSRAIQSSTSVQSAFSQQLSEAESAASSSNSTASSSAMLSSLFPGTSSSSSEDNSNSMLYKIFSGSFPAEFSTGPLSHLSQLEVTRLAARNSISLTPEMIKYLHTRTSNFGGFAGGADHHKGEIIPVRVGYLAKRNTYGFRNWKKFLFIVTKNSLCYRVNDSSSSSSSHGNTSNGNYGGMRFIQLRGASLEPTKDNRFRILNAFDNSDLSAIYNRELSADSAESMRAWMVDIQSAIDEANKEAEALTIDLLGMESRSTDRGNDAHFFALQSSRSSASGEDEAAVASGSTGAGQTPVGMLEGTYSLDPADANNNALAVHAGSRQINTLAASNIRNSVSLINGCMTNGAGGFANTTTNRSIADYASVGDWLASLGLSEYEETFNSNGYKYDMIVAMGLRDADLDYLGIKNPLHRVVLQSGTKLFLEYVHLNVTGARQFDSVTVFVVTAKYKFCRSSLCLRYTDFKRFDTLLRNEIRRAKHAAPLTLPTLPAQGSAVFRSTRDPIFIENRRQALENYLITLSSILYGTPHLKTFLTFLELNS